MMTSAKLGVVLFDAGRLRMLFILHVTGGPAETLDAIGGSLSSAEPRLKNTAVRD